MKCLLCARYLDSVVNRTMSLPSCDHIRSESDIKGHIYRINYFMRNILCAPRAKYRVLEGLEKGMCLALGGHASLGGEPSEES